MGYVYRVRIDGQESWYTAYSPKKLDIGAKFDIQNDACHDLRREAHVLNQVCEALANDVKWHVIFIHIGDGTVEVVLDDRGKSLHSQSTAPVSTPDQTLKADAGKPRLSLVPPEMLWAVGEVMTFGAKKYEAHSWRKVEPERYMDALARHFALYLADPDGVDDESGLPHLWHLTTNAAFLCALSSVSPVMKAVKLPEPGYADKLMRRVCDEGLLSEVKEITE